MDEGVGPDESKVPYRLEVVGVTCDPGLAVARGIWRKVRHPVCMSSMRFQKFLTVTQDRVSGLAPCCEAGLHDESCPLPRPPRLGLSLTRLLPILSRGRVY